MRGTPLSVLRTMLKAEIGSTLTAGVNTADDARFNQLLSNKQVELAGMCDGVFLRDREDVAVVGGQRFAPLPLLNFDRPHTCKVSWNQIWTELDYGINEFDYNVIDSLRTPPMTIDPIKKWLIVEQMDIGLPPTPPTVANTSNVGTLTGVYKYKYTFVTPNGESLPSSVSNSITADGHILHLTNIFDIAQQKVQGVNVNTITSKNLYRTLAGGSDFYFVDTIPIGTSTYDDIRLDSQLSTLAPTTSTATMSFFEVWPMPSTAQTIRFTGERQLQQLVNDTDTADIDDLLLVLQVAAGEAARRELADAPLLIGRAKQRFQQLQASQPNASSVFKVGASRMYQQRKQKRVLMG